MPTTLPILHFNDVYRVGPQNIAGGGTIDVTQFATMLNDLRDAWPKRADGARDGLVLFSGDLFSPSVQSSVTRGKHMVPIINELSPDVAVTGNHEFDFGYPHLTRLVNETNFPWLLSNIVDDTTSNVPEYLNEFMVIERCGVRIGFIGLVESDWIATVPAWPSNFKYRDMVGVAIELSKRLRDPHGEFQCDVIIALTHSRLPNDVQLAKGIHALVPSCQPVGFASTHGADIILGGHDHFYYVSRGITAWEGYDVSQAVLGIETNEDGAFVIKSGTDFRDLTELMLELGDTPLGSVRRKIITGVRGKRHETQPGSVPSQTLKEIISKTLDSVSDELKKPICMISNPLDIRSELIRTSESASANWFADTIHQVYDEALWKMGIAGADGTLLCSGALRGDAVYEPGNITLGDIMEILPFDDSIIALELDGRTIWKAFESGLKRWPAQEGRFPVISGFRVTWDSRKPPGERVLRINLPTSRLIDRKGITHAKSASSMEYEEITCDGVGRKYIVITRAYMAEGHDGFDCLMGHKVLIDKEQGQMMSSVVQKYLLESQRTNRIRWSLNRSEMEMMPRSEDILISWEQRNQEAREYSQRLGRHTLKQARIHWQFLNDFVNAILRFPAYRPTSVIIRGSSQVTHSHRLNGTGRSAGDLRKEAEKQRVEVLKVVIPVVDGRLTDVGRS